MSLSRSCYKSFILLFALLITGKLFAQNGWKDIHLIDTIKYSEYYVNEVFNNKYLPANLFDSKLSTCWVSGSQNDNLQSIYLKLPAIDSLVINIFPGYGKSQNLYLENARPKTIRLSLLYGVNPDGYVTETGKLYKSKKIKYEQIIILSDSNKLNSISLFHNKSELLGSKTRIIEQFKNNFNATIAESSYILKLDFIDSYPGTKYDDVCISEIFFNDCLVSLSSNNNYSGVELFINQEENALIFQRSDTREIIYKDKSAVLQLIEVSENNKWAILISMPNEIEGRAETTYLLVDIINKKIMNSQIEKISKDYIWGDFYFEYQNDLLYLVYATLNGDEYKIKLR